MLLHVGILRSSSGSTYCSLLKLHVKIVNMSLYSSMMLQHIVCLCMYIPPRTENNTYTNTRYAATSLINITTYSQF